MYNKFNLQEKEPPVLSEVPEYHSICLNYKLRYIAEQKVRKDILRDMVIIFTFLLV